MNTPNIYHSNVQPSYQPPPPYQTQMYSTCPRPLHPPSQQFGSRFQLPSQQQFTNSLSYHQPPNQQGGPQCPNFSISTSPQPYYQSSGFDQVQSCNMNFENLSPSLPYQSMQGSNFNQTTSPRLNFNQVPPQGSNFNQVSSHGPNFSHTLPPISNFNQGPNQRPNLNQAPPLGPNFNQIQLPKPIFNHASIPGPNFSHVPPPICPFKPPLHQSYETSCNSVYQPPSQNNSQPQYQVSSQQIFNQSSNFGYNNSTNNNNFNSSRGQNSTQFQSQCEPSNQQYPYHQNSVQYLSRQEFNQPRANFRTPGKFRCPNKNQFSSPQQDTLRNKFHPKQPYQNFNMNIGANFNNKVKNSNISKKDKVQIACNKGDCDFVGHASAVKEHQNLHHRFGLHKKVLYSNSSDAVKKWIEERKKNWPTKEIAMLKLEIQNEKMKRGERIADEDFNRFNNRNDQFNRNGPRRVNNRKKSNFEGTYTEQLEEPMNGNLKRFAGIKDVLIKDESSNDNNNKLGSLKLLEEYEFSDDDGPPEETTIIKETAVLNDSLSVKETSNISSQESVISYLLENNECNKSTQSDTNTTHINKTKKEIILVHDQSSQSPEKKILNTPDKNILMDTPDKNNSIEISDECTTIETEKCENGQKRKKSLKKDNKPVKRIPPPRTPRNEVMERKAALLEALMGNLMRSERNTITQCICYIRNNMHRFTQTQTT